MEAKLNKTLGRGADQAAGTSSWKTCQKDFISSHSLGKEILSGFLSQLWYCLFMFMLAGNVEPPWMLLSGGTSGELGCRESFITPPRPAGCQVRETQPQREQLLSTDTAWRALKQKLLLAVVTGETSEFPLNLAWELPAEPGHSREREKLKTPHRITTQGGLWS